MDIKKEFENPNSGSKLKRGELNKNATIEKKKASAKAKQTNYCRRCQRNLSVKRFFLATDKDLDSNGYFSICEVCCENIFDSFFAAEKDFERAMFKTCKTLNIRFEKKISDWVQEKYENAQKNGEVPASPIGFYRGRMRMFLSDSPDKSDENLDLTFQEYIVINNSDDSIGVEDEEYFKKIWGEGLDISDYLFLEEAFSKWTRTTKCDTYGEELLVRELCHKENEIRKARITGKSVDGLVKSLQEIMKNSALTPALQNAASSGRSAETFGVWIRDIETKRPAEWYEDQKKYRDIEGIDEYNKKYIERAIKNFITGSRDFNVEEALGLDTETED